MRPRDSERSHAGGHVRRVVPERGCEIVERARPGRAREVGADLAPGPADRVTLDAALGVEDTRPRGRVLRRAEDRLGERGRCEQQQPGEDDQAPHGARYRTPSPPETSSYSNTIFNTPGV